MKAFQKYFCMAACVPLLPITVHAKTPTEAQVGIVKTAETSSRNTPTLDELAAIKISFSLENANQRDIIRAIGQSTPQPLKIEGRKPLSLQLTCKVQQVKLGDALYSIATLNSSKLYLITDRFVIATSDLLTEEEKKIAVEYLPGRTVNAPIPKVTMNENDRREQETVQLVVAKSQELIQSLKKSEPESRERHFNEIPLNDRQIVQDLVNLSIVNGAHFIITQDAKIIFRQESADSFRIELDCPDARRSFNWMHEASSSKTAPQNLKQLKETNIKSNKSS